jgi:LEA14-like dessication related protein
MTASPVSRRRCLRHLAAAAPWLLLSACAGLSGRDPLKVDLAGLEALPGEGMELRFMVKLRAQNPNDGAFAYDGVSIELELRGQSFGSGVSDARGSVPRFGEAVIAVPMTVSALAMARQLFSLLREGEASLQQVDYVLRGKLSGPQLGVARFESRGEVALPRLAAARP